MLSHHLFSNFVLFLLPTARYSLEEQCKQIKPCNAFLIALGSAHKQGDEKKGRAKRDPACKVTLHCKM